MNLAYYVVVFDRGTDAWLDLAGLDGAYRQAEGASVFAVETHTLYRREVGPDSRLSVKSWLVAADAKRLHLAHEMTCDGTLVAVHEVMFLHMDLTTRRVKPFTAEQTDYLMTLLGPPPSWLGRRIGMTAAAALTRDVLPSQL